MPSTWLIGIDWGTHSSKLCLSRRSRCVAAPVFSSDLRSVDGQISFGDSEHVNDDEVVRGLKGELIKHSLAIPFWGSDNRLDTGTSLGEAVAFSLTCLLTEARRLLKSQSGEVRFEEVELGFSFPNWLAEDSRKAAVAARNFCDAAHAAIAVLNTWPDTDLPVPRVLYPISKWKSLLKAAKAKFTGINHDALTLETANSKQFSLSEGPLWRFIVESGAAGIPYLRVMDLPPERGIRGLGKLLVVDIGAGSTDVGYMLRTININTGRPVFYHLRPASSFPVAGNQLTNDLLKHFWAQNRRMSYKEAEAYKTSSSSWSNLPFVTAWMKQICDHVETYVRGIPDERWLPVARPLNVVVTGGSALLSGLKEALVGAAREGLRARNIEQATCEAVIAINRYEPRFDFRTEADVARRAVAFGAADSDKPSFRYTSSFDPPATTPTVVAAKGWV